MVRRAAAKKLAKYQSMRDFTKTAEPSGANAPTHAQTHAKTSFVIQKHAARRLHYDFRLELDGVLLSWSVPKGPSLSPAERRLAVRTEDHPLDYADFEGVIPQGQYGGGTVVVWDRGTWTPEGDAQEMMKKGRLTFTLHGEKLSGRWHLIKTKPQDKQETWLLFKGRDDAANDEVDIVENRPESVITGRTVEEIAADADRVWHSSRKAEPTVLEKRAARFIKTAAKHKPAANQNELLELVGKLPLGFKLTNLDKVLYPEQGITKGELIAYLAVVADWMTTGGKGLHVVVPVERRLSWDDFKEFTKLVVEQIEHDEPTRFTTNMAKKARKGKIFLDYLRNGRNATFIAPYSPRARPGAPVAVPIAWEELAHGVDPATFTMETVPRRLAQLPADPWKDMVTVKQSITAAMWRALGRKGSR